MKEFKVGDLVARRGIFEDQICGVVIDKNSRYDLIRVRWAQPMSHLWSDDRCESEVHPNMIEIVNKHLNISETSPSKV